MLKEISYEYSLEGLMLKLKLQYSGHLMWRTDPLENTLMLGKIEDRRRRGQQDEMVGSHHWLNEHEFEQALGVANGQGGLVCYSPWGRKESDTIEQLNWTWVNIICNLKSILNLYEILFSWYSSPTKLFFNERSLYF